jgi:ABC-type branched-subunit amino acid transport system permease subunit
MILASQILDQLNSMDGIFSLEHLAFMFVGGMVCSVTGLLVGYVLLRRRNTQQFDQVNTQEPLIE